MFGVDTRGWKQVGLALGLALIVIRCGAGELDELIVDAVRLSPRAEAARQQVERALAAQRETLGFLDPQLSAGGGISRHPRDVPAVGAFHSLTADALVVQAGLDLALPPGAYLRVGAAERYLIEPDDRYGGLFQTLVGAQVRVPLQRDFGLRQWSLDRLRLSAECAAAVSRLLAVSQEIRHTVELGYIDVQESMAAERVAQTATARFDALLKETEELARLRAVPEYQVLQARMELELRREEEVAARQAVQTALLRLGERIGDGRQRRLASSESMLIGWAAQVALPESLDVGAVLRAHGAYVEQQHRVQAAEADLRRAREELKSDLSLAAGANWQAADAHTPWSGGRALADAHVGGEVVLVWQRALGRRGELGRIAQRQAQLEEAEAEQRAVRLKIETDIQVAVHEFTQAQERLQRTAAAVSAAEQMLQAERERFRLGDGRSRDVLDSQKDLNTVIQRQTRLAAVLLRAHSALQYATGYLYAAQTAPAPSP